MTPGGYESLPCIYPRRPWRRRLQDAEKSLVTGSEPWRRVRGSACYACLFALTEIVHESGKFMAKMHQNAPSRILNFQNFPGAMPPTLRLREALISNLWKRGGRKKDEIKRKGKEKERREGQKGRSRPGLLFKKFCIRHRIRVSCIEMCWIVLHVFVSAYRYIAINPLAIY